METGDEIFSGKLAASSYLKSRFFIDFASTVPIDTIAELLTGEKNPVLKLFSLLKLVRVTRLGKMIARMNVTQQVKNSLKLFQLIFFIIMYLHCSGCLWFVIVSEDERWHPSVDLVRGDMELYSRPVGYQYWVSIYIAVLQMTGNDVYPFGTFQIGYVSTSIIMGALINANIFGNMALIIGELNMKAQAF